MYRPWKPFSLSLPPSLRILPSYLFDPPSFRACRGQADGLSTLRRLTFCNIYPAHLFFRYYSVLSRRPPLVFVFFCFSFDRSYVDRSIREIESVRIFPNLYSKASAVARRDTDSPPIQYLSRHVPSSNNCYPSDTFVRVDTRLKTGPIVSMSVGWRVKGWCRNFESWEGMNPGEKRVGKTERSSRFFFLDLPSNFGNIRKDARMFVKIFVLFDIRVIRYVNSFIIR